MSSSIQVIDPQDVKCINSINCQSQEIIFLWFSIQQVSYFRKYKCPITKDDRKYWGQYSITGIRPTMNYHYKIASFQKSQNLEPNENIILQQMFTVYGQLVSNYIQMFRSHRCVQLSLFLPIPSQNVLPSVDLACLNISSSWTKTADKSCVYCTCTKPA